MVCRYEQAAIDVFNAIPFGAYEPDKKQWNFAVTLHPAP